MTRFEDDRGKVVKKLARYRQYHAVNRAVEKKRLASMPEGDRKCGVVWHTQGSGKSLSIVFYAGKLALLGSLAGVAYLGFLLPAEIQNQYL